MATLAVANPTLLDLAKATDPDGSIAAVVEILNETNEILADMSWVEGNLATGHRTTIRSGLPQPTWRKLYGGVQPTKSTRVQVTDSVGMLEAFAEVDVALADLNGNTSEFRLSEDRPHIEGINQELAESIFYADEGTANEEFTGLSPRFNSLAAENADNIIDALGTGTDNQSIWLVVWGPNTCHGIVPKGSTGGIKTEDQGKIMLQDVDGAGGRMMAYSTHYKVEAGLVVRDWRYIVRICNIDKSDLTADAATGADLPDLLFQAQELIPNLSFGRAAFYMSRTVRAFLRRQMSNKVSGSTLSISDVGGVKVMDFQGTPIRRVDKLAADEARVV